MEMKTNLDIQTVSEEGAKLSVPQGSESDPFHKLAFFNPRMSFNRSVSSLALGACNETDKKFDKITLLDGLCATGARGIRYALENSFVKKVFFVDGNEYALPLLEKNVSLNKLAVKTTWIHSEFNEFLENTEEEFDFLEIDPFGTPAPFLKNALQKISFGKRGYGILSVTATDLAALCGKAGNVCQRNYSAKPMRCSFTHEVALRILVGKIVLDAVELKLSAHPLFSFYNGHAVKTICKISKQTKLTKKSPEKNGFVSLCRNCLARKWGSKKVEKCACGSKMDYAGPLWLGETSEKAFVEKMLGLLKKRKYSESRSIEKMLLPLAAEIGMPPFFYDLHEISEKLITYSPKTAAVLEKLREKGFTGSLTHYEPTGIRTDAPVEELKKCFVAAQESSR